jgi:hypothetical protein
MVEGRRNHFSVPQFGRTQQSFFSGRSNIPQVSALFVDLEQRNEASLDTDASLMMLENHSPLEFMIIMIIIIIACSPLTDGYDDNFFRD